MPGDHPPLPELTRDDDRLREELPRLAAEDPRAARELLLSLLGTESDALSRLLTLFKRAGDGRVRQLVANVVRTARPELAPRLTTWLDAETDEFARHAIESAVASADSTRKARRRRRRRTDGGSFPEEIVHAYQYAASRLRHRIRSDLLPEGRAIVTSLERGAGERSAELHRLRGWLSRLGRIVEFSEVEPDHFDLRPVVLTDWLREMNQQYAEKYREIPLQIRNAPAGAHPVVRASAYLLDTVFWNVWINAQQELGEACALELTITETSDFVSVLVRDSGSGFPSELEDVAFQLRFSSRGRDRGRGLLEVAEAVHRLGGDVSLKRQPQGDLRIVIKLPRHQP